MQLLDGVVFNDAALDPLQWLQDRIIKIIGVNDQEKPLEIQ